MVEKRDGKVWRADHGKRDVKRISVFKGSLFTCFLSYER